MRAITFALASAALLTAACTPPAEKAEPAEAAAPLSAGRDGAYEAARQGPEPFVRALYGLYGQTPAFEMLPPGQEPLYSRMLNARLRADAERAGGSRVLDFDPVCDCQDAEGLTLQTVTVTEGEPGQAEAAVALTNAGEAKALRLKLVKEGPMWKVEDVLIDGRPPLSEAVMKGL